jgi:salicylate hydroxylase
MRREARERHRRGDVRHDLIATKAARSMRVIVVGAGIGGLTAALTLTRAGLDVEVFEQASELHEVGAGIQISPNATRILHRLGLSEALERVAVRPLTFEFLRWDDGRVLMRAPLGDECVRLFGAPYYHFHRADLLAVLAAAVPSKLIHLGHRCVGVAERHDRVEASFQDGSIVEADAIIGADGIHSAVRSAILGPESPRFSGNVAFRGLVPAARLAHLGMEPKSNLWLGPNRHFVHYFVGAGRYVNWVGVVPDEWCVESWTEKGEIADALAKFDGWHRRVREIIAAADITNRWALYDRDPLDTWAIGRVALLGDAAHAMLPFMAQGAVQSVEDTAVLAKCLGAVDAGGVAAALRRYEAIRKPRASQCQLGSRNNAVMYHMPDGEEQRRRDANLSAAIYGLGSRTWLYAHDVEAAMETMQEEPR